jgi:hypothetical protein
MLPRLVSRFPATAAEGGGMTPRNLTLSVFSGRKRGEVKTSSKDLQNIPKIFPKV